MSVPIDRSTLSVEEKVKISNDLTVKIEKGSRNHKKIDLIQCYITSPRVVGVPLHYAVNVLNTTNDDINHFRPELNFTGKLIDEQPEIVDSGLNKLAHERAFTLVASTGKGKTVMGAWFGARLNCVTCILIDRVHLITSWKTTFNKFTDGTVWIVGDEDPPEKMPNYIICNNLRVHKIPEHIRVEISLLIIDEAHKFCTKQRFEQIMIFNPIYIISMTATPNKDDGSFEIINKFSGTYERRYSSNKRIKVFRVNTPLEYSRVINEKTKKLDWSVIDEELHYHPVRNGILLNLILSNLDRKIMVFSGRVDHVDLVIDALKHFKVKCDKMSRNKKTYSDSNVLIGTSSKIGEGFDEATFCPNFSGIHIDMIIIFNSYRSLIRLEQNIGRSRADFPTIYHIVDKDSIIYNQWLGLRKFYLDPECPIRADIKTIPVEGEAVWPFDIMGNWNIDIVNTGTNKTNSTSIDTEDTSALPEIGENTTKPKIKVIRHKPK